MKLAGLNDRLDIKLQVASLIDVVFLLLVYFMVTASLIRREGDLSFVIPISDKRIMKEIPVEALIEIQSDGSVKLEGIQFSGEDRELPELIVEISGLRRVAATQGSEFHVNLLPSQDALHYRIIDVMDACAKADVDILGFSRKEM
ncbi:biopolymer transporter ExbD [Pontiellaceae bacterium B1224]|nr:biopolymer transporter ExbD [Pontiellaceae bacterium B1224]